MADWPCTCSRASTCTSTDENIHSDVCARQMPPYIRLHRRRGRATWLWQVKHQQLFWLRCSTVLLFDHAPRICGFFKIGRWRQTDARACKPEYMLQEALAQALTCARNASDASLQQVARGQAAMESQLASSLNGDSTMARNAWRKRNICEGPLPKDGKPVAAASSSLRPQAHVDDAVQQEQLYVRPEKGGHKSAHVHTRFAKCRFVLKDRLPTPKVIE
eukprot:6202650-Pleurochrysis_carterae.AAC.2